MRQTQVEGRSNNAAGQDLERKDLEKQVDWLFQIFTGRQGVLQHVATVTQKRGAGLWSGPGD